MSSYRHGLSSSYAGKFPALARRRQSVLPLKGHNFDHVIVGHDQMRCPVYLGDTERLEHAVTIGTTGCGKTTYFKNLAAQDIRRGRGALVIDPHGGHDGSLYAELVSEFFDLRPGAFREYLRLHRPIYQKTAAYGHFGRDDHDFTWEKTDKAAALREAAGLGATPAVV